MLAQSIYDNPFRADNPFQPFYQPVPEGRAQSNTQNSSRQSSVSGRRACSIHPRPESLKKSTAADVPDRPAGRHRAASTMPPPSGWPRCPPAGCARPKSTTVGSLQPINVTHNVIISFHIKLLPTHCRAVLLFLPSSGRSFLNPFQHFCPSFTS